MKHAIFLFSLLFALTVSLFIPTNSDACPTCGCTVNLLGKHDSATAENQKWYFRYLYEQVNWHKDGAEEVNRSVNDGHDLHDKTTEDTYHFEFGRHITEDLNVFIDLPYVVRKAVEIEDAGSLGAKQVSKGLGDLQLISDYRFWHNDNSAVSLAGGIKFPTGDTHQENSAGERFETDMQPGSGAYNYIVGGIYKFQNGQWSTTANTSYVFTTEGAQDFQYGDLFTTSVYTEYFLNQNSKYLRTHLGLDTMYQDEKKEKSSGEKNPDMGGQTVFIGPAFKIETSEHLSFNGAFLYPVSQNLNGLSQKLDFTWTAGGQLRW